LSFCVPVRPFPEPTVKAPFRRSEFETTRNPTERSREFRDCSPLCVVGNRSGPTEDEVIRRDSVNEAEASGQALSPLRAFIALTIVGVAAGAVVLVGSVPDSPGPRESAIPVEGASPGRSPSLSPTPGEAEELLGEGEARALFARLRSKLEEAYRQRSVAVLHEAVGRGSAQFARSRSDLRLLERNNLLDRTRTRTLEVSIVAIEPARVVVRERAAVTPRYVDDATHVEVDVQLDRTRSSSEWTLERRGERWVITSSRAT
jgi:hypothetical protein